MSVECGGELGAWLRRLEFRKVQLQLIVFRWLDWPLADTRALLWAMGWRFALRVGVSQRRESLFPRVLVLAFGQRLRVER